MRETTGEHLWSKQVEILEAVRDHRKVAVKAAHGPGKSFTGARAVGWWEDVHPALESFSVTSAPTTPQVNAILWREITRVHRKGKLKGRVTQDAQWKVQDELVAYGRKPADHDEHGFQGIHARYVLVVLDEACHDGQTEVLTEAGWRYFKELGGTERLLTMDPETHETSYVVPSRLYRGHYRGPMYEYRPARGGNFCVTPDHRMYSRARSNKRAAPWGDWRFDRMEQIASINGRYMLKAVETSAPDCDEVEVEECIGIRKTCPARRFPADAWMEFLGWYVSEGHLIRSKGHIYGCGISQDNPDVLGEIHELCLRLGLAAKRYKRQVHIHDMQIGRHLARWGMGALTKRVPDYARHMSARQIRIFLDSFARGDGYLKGSGEVLYTSSADLADDLQEMCVKTGVPSVLRARAIVGVRTTVGDHTATSSADGYVVTRPSQPSLMKLHPKSVEVRDYDGEVFCATVPPHHMLLTRRNGYTLWSGNCGIPAALWTATDTLVTNEDSRILAIGNPDDPTSHFAKVCEGAPEDGSSGMSKAGWWVITISVFDTPNFTGEDVPAELRHYLPSATWVEERRRAWGEGSPLWTSKVEGRFPEDASDGVVPWSALKHCQSAEATGPLAGDRTPVRLGVDVGGSETGDETVIRAVAGRKVLGGEEGDGVWRIRSADSEVIVDEVLHAIRQTVATAVNVDVIGVGFGVTGSLRRRAAREVDWPVTVTGVNVAEAAHEPKRFLNRRAELWWTIGREWSQDGAWDLSDVDDETLLELSEPKYREVNGRVQVESKDDVRKRLQRSTDNADALLLAAILPGKPAKGRSPAGRRTARGPALARTGGRITQ